MTSYTFTATFRSSMWTLFLSIGILRLMDNIPTLDLVSRWDTRWSAWSGLIKISTSIRGEDRLTNRDASVFRPEKSVSWRCQFNRCSTQPLSNIGVLDCRFDEAVDSIGVLESVCCIADSELQIKVMCRKLLVYVVNQNRTLHRSQREYNHISTTLICQFELNLQTRCL